MKFLILFCFFGLTTALVMAQNSSSTKSYAIRLKPGTDLKQSIETFIKENQIKAGAIVTCVGSLTKANIRLSNQADGTIYEGHFEIVSLTGVLSTNGSHLHIAIADENGQTIGGHLLDGCKIYTTAEIIISVLNDLDFKREADSDFGYKELVIKHLN